MHLEQELHWHKWRIDHQINIVQSALCTKGMSVLTQVVLISSGNSGDGKVYTIKS
jgi:hypothetical protein